MPAPATRFGLYAAKKPLVSGADRQATATRRVAAYARVSTASEEQATSYEAQVDYYTGLIATRPDWQFSGIYTDEGITGTYTKHRTGFQNMVADALAGKIDLIVTKSVSRFARNTVDSLTTVRQLKEAGVEIFFEKENIWTLDAKGELLITIMSSLAQEESRSISENVRWGIKKRFADGKVFMPYPHFLGYDKGPDGRPQVNPEQAKLVRRIYRMYLAGNSMNHIALALTDEGIPVPGPRGKRWYAGTIKSFLTNEKYRGDALLQKTYISDFLTKKQVKNKGEMAQYYVTGSPEAIIDPNTWDLVQHELKARKGRRAHYPFTMKLQCGVCGDWYGSKVWHSNDKYRSIVWQCNQEYKIDHSTPMPHLTTTEVEDAFAAALHTYMSQRPVITQRIRAALTHVMDVSKLEAEQAQFVVTIEGLQGLMAKEIDANSHTLQNQDDYRQRFAELETQFEQAILRFEQISAQIDDAQGRHAAMLNYLDTLDSIEREDMLKFSPRLWHILIDRATICATGDIAFTFKDGTTIPTPQQTM